MKKEILEEQARFLEFVKSYEYVNEQGRLDLEAFCVNLSICFSCDGILDQSPQPRDVYDLLIDILSLYSKNEEMSLWVQTQNLIDWSPDIEYMYPDRYRTCIHVAGLIHVMPHWIYNIGHTLMRIPEPESPSKYFGWVRSEWVFVHSFINGFHNFFTELQKDIDKRSVKDRGFLLFEALHKSTSSDVDFDQVANVLKRRNIAQNEAEERIDLAISEGFYLEAITLQECLISNCLYNYLQSINLKAKGLSFQKLISLCKSKCDIGDNLLNQIDDWRIKRNKSIHGYIESKASLLSDSQNDFTLFSKETSLEGQVLCRRTCEWYLSESVDFVPTEFPRSDKKLN